MKPNDTRITCREYRPSDRDSLVQLHNACFPPVSVDYWREWDENDVTAAVALIGDEVVGCVPFHLRQFLVRPGVAVGAAFEYSVCVREELRSKGVGSQLMDCAAKFLRGRADVMMVYRGAETSPGYRFYARNHHHDVAYLRPYVWDSPCAECTDKRVTVHGMEEMFRCEEETLAVFRDAYEAFGGYPSRSPGHYRVMSQNMNWVEVKHEWKYLQCRGNGQLLGYALAGLGATSRRWRVAELAARREAEQTVHTLLDAVARLAGGTPVSFHLTQTDPAAPLLLQRGAKPIERAKSSMMIMARIFDPTALAKRVWAPSAGVPNADVTAWSPLRQAVIYRGPGKPERHITLEMKDAILARLLLSRLDLADAVRQELVTTTGATPDDVDTISRALPFTPWVHHDIDYI